MTETSPHDLLQAMLQEHRELMQRIADLKHFWEEVNELGQGPKYEEMESRVRELRDQLATHFVHEERDGYLAPALEAAPRLSSQAEQLQKQHLEFLNLLDHFIGKLQACESAFHCWQEVGVEFEEFLKRLHEHETAEIMLVQSAFEDDIGSAD